MPTAMKVTRSGPLAALLTLAATLTGGCAHTEYDVLQPQDLARRVGTKQWVTAPVEPLEYQMIASDDHLVVRAYNRSDEPIQLLTDRSVLVDPFGQSHPLAVRDRTILPGSYVKLVLPPIRRQIVPTGPTIGIGFGTVFGSARRHGRYGRYGGYGFGYNALYYDQPRYYAVYGGDDEAIYWRWEDGGTVRLVLVYLRGDRLPGPPPPPPPDTRPADRGPAAGPETFTHEFVFKSVKV